MDLTKRVLVIGDGCRDMFIYGMCSRLSPEAPVPIFNPTRTISNDGMAMNVLKNIESLGIICDIITNDNRPIKTRYVDEVSNQILLRVDKYDTIERIDLERLTSIDFSLYYAIVISDYNKGFLDYNDIAYISNSHPLTFMDTKKDITFDWCENIKYIKINEKEFNTNKIYLTNHYHNNLIVTFGKDGAMLHGVKYPISDEHPVRDLSGAGDTFLAGLVADFVKNNDISSAIRFANKCASWIVTQRGVAVIDLNMVK